MTAAPTVSVVMPTYNRRGFLRSAVEPLLADDAALEVVVVVDGSLDGSFELLQEMAAADPRLRPHRTENRGMAHARQHGLEAARGDVVLFLDDDVEPGPGLVAGHAARHASGPGLVVVGYMPTFRPPQRKPGMFATYIYADEYERMAEAYQHDPACILRNLWMGNVSMRRTDCLEVGFLSAALAELDTEALGIPGKRFPPGHEDREFGFRCEAAGLTAEFDRALYGLHRHEKDMNEYRRFARGQGTWKWLIHRLHGEVLGPLSEDVYERGLPLPGRLLLRACRLATVRSALVAAGAALARLTGKLRAFKLEETFARAVRRIENQHGALSVARRDARAAGCA